MAENILEKIIKKKIEKIEDLKKTTKFLKCRCKGCNNMVQVAKTSISVICASCTFKMAEGLLEYSK